jgi:hypothetical protein
MGVPLGFVALSAIKGFVMYLQTETMPEQIREFGMLGSVEGPDAQQELVIISGEEGLAEGHSRWTD